MTWLMRLERAQTVYESLNYVDTMVCMLHSELKPLGCNQYTVYCRNPKLKYFSGKCLMISHCTSKKARNRIKYNILEILNETTYIYIHQVQMYNTKRSQ